MAAISADRTGPAKLADAYGAIRRGHCYAVPHRPGDVTKGRVQTPLQGSGYGSTIRRGGAAVKLTEEQWDIGHLHEHLQAAAELEAWTIPYYLSAMFSVVDRSSEAYQLVQSVVNQEMLHLQLVANIANSYGYSPVLTPGEFVYAGDRVPHLDFTLDPDNPIPQFTPYTAEIGPLDQPRVNAMCLIEYPEWDTGGKPDYQDDVTDYGSIGEFYDALEYGARQLADHIAGGQPGRPVFGVLSRVARR